MSAAPMALLFAGQGSQATGMGKDLVVACDGCRDIFAQADRAVGFELSRIMAHGPADELRRTAVAQPALLVLGVAQATHLASLGVRPAIMAGHSLGQYTALVVTGAIAFDDAVRLVALRGKLMQEAVPEGHGAMAAVSGLDRSTVHAACMSAAADTGGTVTIACYNAPGRLVIAGDAVAVEAAMQICDEADGGVLPLEVSAPFHCALLAPMVPEFQIALADVAIRRPEIPIVDNVTGDEVAEPESIRRVLLRQIEAPVLFEESLRYIGNRGIRRFVQCGVGASLLGFAKRAVPEATYLEADELIAQLDPAAEAAHVAL